MFTRLSSRFKIIFCVVAVGAVGSHYYITAKQEVERLATQVQHGDQDARLRAISGLADMGSSASGAAEDLAKLLDDSDAQIRSAAADALIRINRGAAVAGLKDALHSRDQAVRLDAADYLERIGTPSALHALETVNTRAEENRERAALGTISKSILKDQRREEKKKYREHLQTYEK